MRILQLVSKPQRRGAEIFALQLGTALRDQGNAVRTVYLYPYRREDALPLRADDCLLAGPERPRLEKMPGFDPARLLALRRLIRQFQPDVVQVGGGRTVKYGALAALFEPGRRWRLICRNIGQASDWLRDGAGRLVYQKLVMPRMDGVVSVTQATLEDFQRLYRPAVPIIWISTGIDPDSLASDRDRTAIRRELDVSPDAPVALFVGRLIPAKRPDRLLRVAQQVIEQEPAFVLWLVGDGPLRAEVERQAEQAGLGDRVRFLGAQSEVGAYMKAADLFLLTSDSEGIPRVILEAGLMRLPVVSASVGGIPEFVRQGETGLLAAPADETGLAQAVLTLAQQPEKRERMGRQAQAFIRANYTMDKIAQKYMDFYRHVASQTAVGD